MEEAYLGVDIGSISTKGVIIDKNYKILDRRRSDGRSEKTDRASGEAV